MEHEEKKILVVPFFLTCMYDDGRSVKYCHFFIVFHTGVCYTTHHHVVIGFVTFTGGHYWGHVCRMYVESRSGMTLEYRMKSG